MFNGVGFVDEFYCEHWAGVVGRDCFLYSGILLVLVEGLKGLKLTMRMPLYRSSWI